MGTPHPSEFSFALAFAGVKALDSKPVHDQLLGKQLARQRSELFFRATPKRCFPSVLRSWVCQLHKNPPSLRVSIVETRCIRVPETCGQFAWQKPRPTQARFDENNQTRTYSKNTTQRYMQTKRREHNSPAEEILRPEAHSRRFTCHASPGSLKTISCDRVRRGAHDRRTKKR